MANANNFLIGANDEHGLNPPTSGKRTPIMPYVDRSFYENEFNRQCKNDFIIALLRCGFNIFDVKPEINDLSISTRVARINRQRLTYLINFGYNAFGSGNAFNSIQGAINFYSPLNRFSEESRILSEDLGVAIAQLPFVSFRGTSEINNVGVLQNVNCPSTLLEPGFMTNYTEAKLMLDPTFVLNIAEAVAKEICRKLDVPFVERNNLSAYQTVRLNYRGKSVLLVQYLLNYYGYDLDLDGIFGNATRNAVLDFQQDNNLQADGIVGVNTYRALLNLGYTNQILRRGSKLSSVKFAQLKLLSKLYNVGEIDGVFGTITQNAVKEFQSENDLQVDGIIGPQTWQKLSLINQGRPFPSN